MLAFVQEKIEPPVYVSDRRLVKAIQLLQVAAFCNGRNSVSEYDVLLMQVRVKAAKTCW